ncbi:hypothetical protein BMS3Bbin10_02126 [bacterium BMS3Bbin10]|nr:hypothetical protein BMS3Bbin10_02126 [bacterium BMS3Bbin10]
MARGHGARLDLDQPALYESSLGWPDPHILRDAAPPLLRMRRGFAISSTLILRRRVSAVSKDVRIGQRQLPPDLT